MKLGLAAILFAAAGQSQAALMWYNGYPDLVSALANEILTQVSDARVYDDFNVTSAVTVTEVFTNNFMNFAATSALWEIRSGVSAGVGGTVVASGTGAATQTANGFVAFGYTGFTIDVSGLSVALTPGTYWLMVAPIDSGSGRSFVASTSGANAVGTPAGNNGNAFFDSIFFGSNFAPTATQGHPDYDYSMGVVGNAGAVPEPSSLALLGIGAFGMGFRAVRRRCQDRRSEQARLLQPSRRS
jgi:hypothetical protein